MFKLNLRTEQQRPKAKIREWTDDVEISMHITMMQQMVAIQAKENTRTLNIPLARQMHAPMQIFVRTIINNAGQGRPANNAPLLPDPSAY